MTDINNLFSMQHMTACDTGLNYQIAQRFIAETEGDILSEKAQFAVSKKIPFLDVLAKIKGHMTEVRAVSMLENRSDRREIVLTGKLHNNPVLMFINSDDHPDVHDITMEIMAYPQAAISLKEAILADFENEKMGMIKWWFQGAHGAETREVYLPPLKTKIRPEYYPDMGDPAKYMADFMEADESILLMAGPPGTGKTTLLRHLIAEHRLSAHVIYDEKIMEKDSVFQNFLFEERGDIMIIEDADTLLLDREKDNNKLMSRFLNISDGLIKLPNKKLVFTTNLSDFNKVDQALMRPGRCFGVLHTRALNLTEAQAAARVAGMPVPLEKREWTIADIFNQGRQRQQIRTVGFGVR